MRYDIPSRTRGSVRLYGPGAGKSSFRVVWVDDDGKQRERTSTTFEAADTLAESVANELAVRQPAGPVDDPSLGDLLIHYLDGDGRSKQWRSEKSARRPAQIAKRILTEDDLRRPAQELLEPGGHRLLSDIMRRAQSQGCLPGTSEYAKAGALLKTVLDVADKDGLIAITETNPMAHIPYRLSEFSADPDPRLLTVNYIGEELRPPTDRVLDFIDATESMFGRLEAQYVQVLAFSGARPGEANALTGRQLRTDHPGLLIDQQVLELTATEATAVGGDSTPIRLPKWQLKRNAWLPQDLLDQLHEIASTGTLGPHGVLFPSPAGQIRRQGNWRRDVFNPVATRVGWPHREVHVRGRAERHWVWPVYAFRHHYANYLLKDLSQPLVAVARFMGHRDVRVTERMYLKTELRDLDIAAAAHKKGTTHARLERPAHRP